jgi:hypothetical protein
MRARRSADLRAPAARRRDVKSEAIKTGGDVLSLAVVASTLLEWLPALAAVVSIIWGVIRIYETRTVQALVARWMAR